MGKKALRGKKKLMVEALRLGLGVVTTACKQVGISRETHYNWLKTDENYELWVKDIPEMTLDFVENSLLKKIQDGNTASILFYLKTKGKDRGYVEKQEQLVEHKGESIKIIIEEKTPDGDQSSTES